MRFLRVPDSVVHLGGQLHGWLYTCEGQYNDYFIPQLRGEVDDRYAVLSSAFFQDLGGGGGGGSCTRMSLMMYSRDILHTDTMMNDAADASTAIDHDVYSLLSVMPRTYIQLKLLLCII